MALYLSKRMLNVTKSARVKIDLTKLGKVQLNRLHKFLTTGSVSGNGVPAQIAVGILQEYQAPYMHYYSQWRFTWGNLPNETLEQISIVGNAVKLSAPNLEVTRYETLDWLDDLVTPKPSDELYIYRLKNAYRYDPPGYQAYIDFLKAITVPQSDTITQLAESIKTRSIKEITIQIYTGE
jgi:hypothetical protein